MKFIAPKFESATTVQCEVYRQLANLGIQTEAEYKTSGCRFDLVVIQDGKVVAIIETKKAYVKPGPPREGRQFKKYSSFGIPLIYTLGLGQVPDTIEQVKKIINYIDKDLEV